MPYDLVDLNNFSIQNGGAAHGERLAVLFSADQH